MRVQAKTLVGSFVVRVRALFLAETLESPQHVLNIFKWSNGVKGGWGALLDGAAI